MSMSVELFVKKYKDFKLKIPNAYTHNINSIKLSRLIETLEFNMSINSIKAIILFGSTIKHQKYKKKKWLGFTCGVTPLYEPEDVDFLVLTEKIELHEIEIPKLYQTMKDFYGPYETLKEQGVHIINRTVKQFNSNFDSVCSTAKEQGVVLCGNVVTNNVFNRKIFFLDKNILEVK